MNFQQYNATLDGIRARFMARTHHNVDISYDLKLLGCSSDRARLFIREWTAERTVHEMIPERRPGR